MFDIENLRKKGIPESSIKICEEINENDRKREGCALHRFVRKDTLPFKLICENCGCKMDIQYVIGYRDGLRHGRADAREPGRRT
jgi:hypothetical protein